MTARGEERDLGYFAVPAVGSLAATGSRWEPYRLIDPAGPLAALTLDPAQAEDLAKDWRRLPIEQIGCLRRHKNLTAHLDRLIGHLQPGPTLDTLAAWIDVRKNLP